MMATTSQSGAPQGLTSHVLDTLRGLPASGVRLELWQVASNQCVQATQTDHEGRCQLAQTLAVGTYEIRFYIGEYFAATQAALPDPAFLDLVSVRFSVADAARHYHIPLVASPWSYTTYKGGAPSEGH